MLNVAKTLARPYTPIVLAILVGILGLAVYFTTPTDVFPNIDIPVASVIWQYSGASPKDMEQRVVSFAERSYSSSVNDIEHIESQTMPGLSVIKIYFQPGAHVDAAVAQITATSQTVLKAMPPGITPPLIIQYNASSVPILQLGISGEGYSPSRLQDYAQNFIRIQLAAVRGAAIPSPYGGSTRLIAVDLDQEKLLAKGLTPMDAVNAINTQNLILPGGSAKMGRREYTVSLNSSPLSIDEFNQMPITNTKGETVYMRDIAQVHDGAAVQTNIVDKDGRPSVLLTVLKGGDASTLDVVQHIKEALPKVRATLPAGLHVDIVSDQSTFVRASVDSVVREGLIAAMLTSVMILVFLGSWRSTLIICLSIPLSILTAMIGLRIAGQTINVMSLGGLALAIGMLVDDAIVGIENLYRNLGLGKNLHRAIVDGWSQIAGPQLISTSAICIVFIPIMLLTGVTGSLFKPLAIAVVFAMIASYVLSRTLVPVMASWMLDPETSLHAHGHEPTGVEPRHHRPDESGAMPGHVSVPVESKGDFVWRLHLRLNVYFERLLDVYRSAIARVMKHRTQTLVGFSCFYGLCLLLLPFIGRDFFPNIDAGGFRLHVRAPSGTRIEETRMLYARVEHVIASKIPARELDLTLDNLGLPVGGVNIAYNTTGAIGPSDGEILVQLKNGHGPTADYIEKLRHDLNREFPGVVFFFQPADITTQILNFGLPAPFDIQVVGANTKNFSYASDLLRRLKQVPGMVDVHLHQVLDDPELHFTVDRVRAKQLGLAQRDIANNLLVSLSSSGQVLPNYWVDPRNGVNYLVAVQTPQYRESTLSEVRRIPLPGLSGSTGGFEGSSTELLDNLTTMKRDKLPAVINHYNVQPTYDIYANIAGRDLGGASQDVQSVIRSMQNALPKGSSVVVRGQVESMNTSFSGLGLGLIAAIGLVYLLLVVNYQSWIDPFIIISALPGALSGIALMLFACNTNLSVPALMGAIMCIGVATANSVLVVNFANERRHEGDDAITAAVTAGCTRLRPVLMTASAMILGMVPMALALGEGGEQNAPLGRAVIGGLLVATVTTLFFVPVVYSFLRRKHSSLVGPAAGGIEAS